MRIKCFNMRQLYTNENVSKRDNYIGIECFNTRQLYANKTL